MNHRAVGRATPTEPRGRPRASRCGLLGLIVPVLTLIGCPSGGGLPDDDGTFVVDSHTDADFASFPKKTEAFGIPIYAAGSVENTKVLHAAHVLAEYLDNDEDGDADNPSVLEAMKSVDSYLVMWADESDLDFEWPDRGRGQDLGADETVPEWHDDRTARFDASIEEVLHLITGAGYEEAYPDVFGVDPGTELTNAMDIARGGHFQQIPDPYPATAWYSYDDPTCDYGCMAAEYHYWTLTSLLGAQTERAQDIEHEWRLPTPELMRSTDVAATALLEDPAYAFPTTLPDGVYSP